MSVLLHPDLTDLIDYHLADTGGKDDAELEQHLFECGACANRLDGIHRVAAALVAVLRRGEIGSGATTALLNRMSRDRLNVRHYAIEPGEVVACTVGENDDFMAGRFVLPDGDGHSRIDMRVLDSDDRELMRVDDIVIDARAREAILFIPASPVLSEGSALTHYVLVNPRANGDREIARYSMNHTAASDEGSP